MTDLLIVLTFGLALIISVIWVFIEYLPLLRQAPGADPNGETVKLDIYLYGDLSTNPTKQRHIIVPSAGYFRRLVDHLEVKKKELKKQWDSSPRFKTQWSHESVLSKRKKLQSVKDELLFAISGYIGKDMPLLEAICSDLVVDNLLAEKRGDDGFSRILDRCLHGTIQDPPEHDKMYWIIHRLVSECGGKNRDERHARRSFLSIFRRLCIYSFCIRALEDYDGSALLGPDSTGRRKPTKTVQSIVQTVISAGAITLLVLATKQFLNVVGFAPPITVDGGVSGIPSL